MRERGAPRQQPDDVLPKGVRYLVSQALGVSRRGFRRGD